MRLSEQEWQIITRALKYAASLFEMDDETWDSHEVAFALRLYADLRIGEREICAARTTAEPSDISPRAH